MRIQRPVITTLSVRNIMEAILKIYSSLIRRDIDEENFRFTDDTTKSEAVNIHKINDLPTANKLMEGAYYTTNDQFPTTNIANEYRNMSTYINSEIKLRNCKIIKSFTVDSFEKKTEKTIADIAVANRTFSSGAATETAEKYRRKVNRANYRKWLEEKRGLQFAYVDAVVQKPVNSRIVDYSVSGSIYNSSSSGIWSNVYLQHESDEELIFRGVVYIGKALTTEEFINVDWDIQIKLEEIL